MTYTKDNEKVIILSTKSARAPYVSVTFVRGSLPALEKHRNWTAAYSLVKGFSFIPRGAFPIEESIARAMAGVQEELS